MKRSVSRLSIGSTLYFPASTYHMAIISISRAPLVLRQVPGFRRILLHVVKFPVFGIQLAQLVFRDRRAKLHRRFRKRRPRVRTDGAPAIVIDRPVTEHLEILRVMLRCGLGVFECMFEADAFDRRLRDSADLLRRIDPQALQNRRHHVDGMRELRAGSGPSL